MQKILLISLFLLSSSATIEFGKETSYDSSSNKDLEFTYSGDGYVFAYVSCGTVDNLDVDYSTGNGLIQSTSCNKPGVGFLFNPSIGTKYFISLEANANRKTVEQFG